MPDVVAGIYCRISLAAMGDTTKTDDQARICRELAARLGWRIADDVGHPEPDGVYTDHARSAWQKNRKRPAWDQMLADVDAGKLTAIVVYHGDRLVRRPEDLTDLLRLAEGKGVKLASPTGTKDLDSERLELWIRAAFAEEESQRTSERRKAQYERWRRAGKVRSGGRGGRAFGFATDGLTHIPAEAELVRAAADMLLSGLRAGEIARWLNDKGAVTPAGNPFGHATVRNMLARPRYAGLMPDAVSPAAWEPVVDRETWEKACAILKARAAGFGYATNARKYLLSGIAVCGSCGRPLQIWQSKGRGDGAYQLGYACVREGGCRKVYRSQPLLDGYVARAAWNRVTHPDNPVAHAPETPGLAMEFANLTTARAEAEAAITDPALGGRLPLLLARLDSIDKRLAELRALAGDDARHRLLAAHRGVTWDEFCALPLQVRRSLVAACFEVTVLPASKRGPGFRTEDVRLIAK